MMLSMPSFGFEKTWWTYDLSTGSKWSSLLQICLPALYFAAYFQVFACNLYTKKKVFGDTAKSEKTRKRKQNPVLQNSSIVSLPAFLPRYLVQSAYLLITPLNKIKCPNYPSTTTRSGNKSEQQTTNSTMAPQ